MPMTVNSEGKLAQRRTRTFDIKPGKRERTPLIITITGPSGTGKTYSGLRLARGIQRVIGGKLGFVDTEARRGLHYVDTFAIDEYVDMEPPFGPLDYMDAIEQVINKGAKVVVVDQMTHEHSGEGGVMDQIDRWLDDQCGNDWKEREKMNMIAHARVKPQRKALNNRLVQLGRDGVMLILLYRARDIVKPMTKAEKEEAAKKGQPAGIRDLGLQPETTSPLIYETTIGFLLKPGADGKPTILAKAATDEEKTVAKTPAQFRSWDLSAQLDEAMGEKLARWAQGDQVEGAAPAQGGATATPAQTRPAAAARGAAPSSNASVLKNARDWLVFWEKAGIAPARVLAALGRASIEEVTGNDNGTMRNWQQAHAAKTKTLEELFPAPAPVSDSKVSDDQEPPPDEEKGDVPEDWKI